MRDAGENGSGTWDNRKCNGGIRDKNTSVEARFAHFDRGTRDSFKIDSGMRDDKRKILRYRTIMWRIATLTRRDREKHCHWSGMAGLR